MTEGRPPHYVLLTQSTIPSSSSAPGKEPVQKIVHPIVHYHYADDPPLSIIPALDRSYIILDFDPDSPNPPTVSSISGDTAVVGVKVTEAPGAADGELNPNMYLIETVLVSQPDSSRYCYPTNTYAGHS